jgi:hypothetical protein
LGSGKILNDVLAKSEDLFLGGCEPDRALRFIGANAFFNLVSGPHADQAGFVPQLRLDNAAQSGPGEFTISLTVPATAASGTYRRGTVEANTHEVGLSYNQDLPSLAITVENPAHFTRPTLKSVKELSRP